MNEPDEKQPLMSDHLRQFLWRRLYELAGICIVMSALILVTILITFDKNDPSLNTSSGQDIQNLFGAPGAQIARSLFEGFGPAAPLFCIGIFFWGMWIIIKKRLTNWKLRLPAMILSVLFVSTGSAVLPFKLGWGNIAGEMIFKKSLMVFDNISTPPWFETSYLIAGLYLAIGICLFIWSAGLTRRQISWLWIIAGYGKKLISAMFAFLPKKSQKQTPDYPPDDAHDDMMGIAADKIIDKAERKKEKKKSTRKMPRVEPVFLPSGASSTGQQPPISPMKTPKKNQQIFDFGGDGKFKLPALSLLKTPPKASVGPDNEILKQKIILLKQVLEDFRIQGNIDDVRYGPVVTRYDLNPAPGTKSQRVIALADDISRSMSALAVRVAVVPGQNVIGIELPNENREIVLLRHIFDDPAWAANTGKLPMALGKDIAGGPVIADLAKMPHLLVAGTTGSGKSVGINVMILSLLYRYSPEECRLIMIDPKMLELSVYDGIPHLLTPVVTDSSKAVMALKWAVREMESRYQNMAKMGVRNIDGYNERLADAREKGEVLTRRVQTGFDPETGKPIYEEDVLDLAPLPYIVVVIDEVADLMMVAGKEIEAAVQRLAQMARAAGIHVIMATQRPSVDVITGTIKANFPTRISFQVTSRIDSRTILGEQGAEQLLGKGDMLYMEGGGRVIRVHGPFVDDREVEDVANFLRLQGEPEYNERVTEEDEPESALNPDRNAASAASGNSLYDETVALVIREQKASTSFVQRHLKIGYNRAATLIEEMENAGVISPANHVGKRDVLISNDDQ